MDSTTNAIYLRRRGKIIPPTTDGGAIAPPSYLPALLKNIEAFGFTFSEPLVQACQLLSGKQLVALNRNLPATLRELKGAHQEFHPMYPDFPAQVMEMEEGRLYLNAILHYLTEGRYLPPTEVRERLPLLDNVELQVIEQGELSEFERLFGQIAGSNTSLSEQDKLDLFAIAAEYGAEVVRLLPEAIPQKENMAYVAVLLMQCTDDATEFIRRYCRTATDVLRLAVAMSGGDISLATATRFRSFRRKERRMLLSLLNSAPNLVEDMLRWKGRWIRLGERLHSGEYAKDFPVAAGAFTVLCNDSPVATFNSLLEAALEKGDVPRALNSLQARPGDFARRLDHLLRTDASLQEAILEKFGEAAAKVSTPLLLQVMAHFRSDRFPLRVFFPKGNVAKSFALPNNLPSLPATIRVCVTALCEAALVERFRASPPLGRVYLDPALADYNVPLAARSASKAFRTVSRGSRLSLPPDCHTLRFFVWWKNGDERTDIDLSATLFDEDFRYKDIVSYYNLKSYGGHHSGDIVDAPNGASEFIDITFKKAREKGARYVVMSLTSYTQQPYCDLPECFAGWMARKQPKSGEIYEPKTVHDKLDITADTRIALPLIIDMKDEKVIWCDMALRRHPNWNNNVHNNMSGIAATLQSFTQLNRATLFDVFRLHITARGEFVATPEEADREFSVRIGTPFRQEEIASEFMA